MLCSKSKSHCAQSLVLGNFCPPHLPPRPAAARPFAGAVGEALELRVVGLGVRGGERVCRGGGEEGGREGVSWMVWVE
jgi:hypothetical protein